MIDHTTESLILFDDAGSEIPGNPSRCTLYRWMLRGSRGVKIETLICGNKRFTSREAIARFIAAQNAADAPATPVITPAQRRRQSEAARVELERAGV